MTEKDPPKNSGFGLGKIYAEFGAPRLIVRPAPPQGEVEAPGEVRDEGK